MRISVSLIVGIATFLVAACTTNISGDPHYDTGFQQGQVYVFTQELHGVVDRHFGSIRSISLLTPTGYEAQLQKNEEARRVGKPALLVSSGEKEMVRLEKGTEILVTKVFLDRTGDGTEMVLMAEFVNGVFRNKNADLWDICHHKKFAGAGMFASLEVRDPEFLTEKEKAQSGSRR